MRVLNMFIYIYIYKRLLMFQHAAVNKAIRERRCTNKPFTFVNKSRKQATTRKKKCNLENLCLFFLRKTYVFSSDVEIRDGWARTHISLIYKKCVYKLGESNNFN